MRFGILGPTQVELADGRSVAVGGPRVRALLARLLLDAGRVVGPESLIDAVYDDRPPAGAANALQSQVSRLRQALRDDAPDEASRLVQHSPAGYRLSIDPETVDVHRFTRLVETGQRLLRNGDPRRATETLREALALWRGTALADVTGGPFALSQAARLDELRLAAVEDRVEAELALGGPGALVAELRQLVSTHPLRERLRSQLMRALYAAGRPAEALAAYGEARLTLAEELGIEPSAELTAVQLAVLRGEPTPSPYPPAGVAFRAGHEPATDPAGGGVPAQLTSFVGRSAELERVAALLRDARLLTLTGPGGAGKTRLAIEAAARQPGEVQFVELAPLTRGAGNADTPRDAAVPRDTVTAARRDAVAQAVLGGLGLREGGLLIPAHGQPGALIDRLVTALAGRPVLLILDNCEHIVEDAARLAGRLLRACPALRIMATSREPLGVTGETLCPVPPLALPAPGATPAEALACPAVRLFADRAAAVRPGFTVDETTVDDVGRICRTLDGLPLAIELAAARLRGLPVEQVAARLDDRFRLLSRGSRATDTRHRTLRGVVAWSWELLDAQERALARRLTVFVGGVTAAAAATVCSPAARADTAPHPTEPHPAEPCTTEPDAAELADVADALAALADKSLIEAEPGLRRFRMLETVRAFCAEQLEEAGESTPVRRAHATYFLRLARAADPRLRGKEQLRWLRRLDADRENLRAAVRYCCDQADIPAALWLVSATAGYWWLRGLRSEAAEQARGVLGRIDDLGLGEADLRAAGLVEEYALCLLTATQDGPPPARHAAYLRTATSLMADLTVLRQPLLHVLWGSAAGPPADDVAEPMAAQMARGDAWTAALAHYGAGLVDSYGGRVDTAEASLTAAHAGFAAVGERWGLAMTLAELARLASWRGDRERFLSLVDEALAAAGQLDSADDMATLLCLRGEGNTRAGDLATAAADLARAAALARRAGAPETLGAAYLGLGQVARLSGDLDAAQRWLERALAACPPGSFGAAENRSEVFVALGRVAQARGDVDAARGWHRRALSAAAERGNALNSTLAGTVEALAEPLLLETAGADGEARSAGADGGAGSAEAEGDAGRRAAVLLGAGEALRGLPIAGDPDAARTAGIARVRLGGAAFDAAYAEGAAMHRDEILALARRESAPRRPGPGGD